MHAFTFLFFFPYYYFRVSQNIFLSFYRVFFSSSSVFSSSSQIGNCFSFQCYFFGFEKHFTLSLNFRIKPFLSYFYLTFHWLWGNSELWYSEFPGITTNKTGFLTQISLISAHGSTILCRDIWTRPFNTTFRFSYFD